MIKFFIILIGMLAAWGPAAWAASDCAGPELVVTAPRNGYKTLYAAVTVRGYLCRNYPLIMIRNETTNVETFTETREVCDTSECRYHFAAPVRELVLGENHITAVIPGEEEFEVAIEVIRTALAGM